MSTALSEIDILISRDPENPFYQELKGQILFESGRAPESVEFHQRSVELMPGAPQLLINYGRSLIARDNIGDVEAGEGALRDALALEPNNAFAWRELAVALDKQGRRHEAELATAERAFYVGDYPGAQVFSQRALLGLEPGTTQWRRASDIAAITDPRLAENRRRFGR